jgi:hypothetical protein
LPPNLPAAQTANRSLAMLSLARFEKNSFRLPIHLNLQRDEPA